MVYRTFRGETNIDIEYERPDQTAIDGCGFGVNADSAEAPAMVRRIATALAALGAEGQPGVKAEPPLGPGKRYSAQPDPAVRQVGQTK